MESAEPLLEQSNEKSGEVKEVTKLTPLLPLLLQKASKVVVKRKVEEPVKICLSANKRSTKRPKYLSDYDLSTKASDVKVEEANQIALGSILNPLTDHDYDQPSIGVDNSVEDEKVFSEDSKEWFKKDIVVGEDKNFDQVMHVYYLPKDSAIPGQPMAEKASEPPNQKRGTQPRDYRCKICFKASKAEAVGERGAIWYSSVSGLQEHIVIQHMGYTREESRKRRALALNHEAFEQVPAEQNDPLDNSNPSQTELPPGWQRQIRSCKRGSVRDADDLICEFVHPSGQKFSDINNLKVFLEQSGDKSIDLNAFDFTISEEERKISLHAEDKHKYRCKLCNVWFSSKQNNGGNALSLHIAVKHMGLTRMEFKKNFKKFRPLTVQHPAYEKILGKTKEEEPKETVLPTTLDGKVPMYDDPNLPSGWQRKIQTCKTGVKAGDLECVIVHPSGQKFKKRGALRNFLKKNGDTTVDPSSINFSVFGDNKSTTGRQLPEAATAPGKIIGIIEKWVESGDILISNSEENMSAGRDVPKANLLSKSVECHICKSELPDAGSLNFHYIKKHGGKYIACRLCDDTDLMTKAEFLKHCNSLHEGYQSSCDLCPHKFKTMTNKSLENAGGWHPMHEHRLRQHSVVPPFGIKVYTCTFKHPPQSNARTKGGKIPVCPYSTTSHNVIYDHCVRVHKLEVENVYQCNQCDQSFPLRQNLVDHLKTAHSDGSQCSHCGKLFKDELKLRDHTTRVHIKTLEERKLKYLCHLCEQSFAWSHHLKRHIDVVHLKLYKQKAYVTKKRKEKQAKRGNGPAMGIFSLQNSLVGWRKDCPTCGKVFKGTDKMLIHVKSFHQEIREYRCKLCDKWFTTGANLLEHIATKHLGLTAKEFRKQSEGTKNGKKQEHREAIKNHEAFEYIPQKSLLEIAKEIQAASLT